MRWTWLPLSLLASSCASAPPPLPAPPPPKSPSELTAWQTPPPIAPDGELQLGWSVRRETLPNGMGVTVVARPETQVTAIELWLPSAADASHGAVVALGEALRAGTRTTQGVLVNPKLAQRPISVGTSATGTAFAWQVLPRASQLAIDLLADFVAHPAFDAAETQLRLHQELSAIQRYSGSTAHLADLARDAIPGIDIENPEHEARGLIGLDAQRLAELHRCAISPVGAELAVVGPLDLELTLSWARSSFADFRVSEGCASAVAAPAPITPEESRLEQPLLQKVYGNFYDPFVIIAIPGPAPGTDDYLPFALLAALLDERDRGSAEELRHAGTTYGIHSKLNYGFPRLTLLELSGQVDPESAQSAIRSLVEDVRGLAASLNAEELEQVKRRWRSNYVISLSNNAAVASGVLWELRRGRSPQGMETWLDELRGVSVERCREVAQRWLVPANPSIAVSGIPVTLMRGLGLGARLRELYWTDRPQEHKKAL